MSVLVVCMYVYHIYAWCLQRSLELELGMVGNSCVGAGNQTLTLWEQGL